MATQMIAGIEIETQLIAVVVGWFLGAVSTFGINWLNANREEQDHKNELRREIYIQFLSFKAGIGTALVLATDAQVQKDALIVIKLKAYGSSEVASMVKDITFVSDIPKDMMMELEQKIKNELQKLV